jgi:tetratricopeptide (TPR) repeat protein
MDNAINDATKTISLNPANATAFNNRGVAYLKKGDLDQAIKDFTEAIRINPDFALPYGGRGDAWWRKQDYYLVIEDYKKFLELGGQNTKEIERRLDESKKETGG